MQYYDSYTYKKPKKSARSGLKKIFFCAFILVLVIIYIIYYVNPKILYASEAEIKSLAITEINKSVKMVTILPNLYNDLIKISYNNDGDINLISTNSFAVNQLSTAIIDKTQQSLKALGEQGIKINLGNFTGIAFLSNLGPRVTIKMTPIGATTTKIYSTFAEKGINQTLHELFLKINVDIKVILPIRSLNIKLQSEILIAENVIVGKVPSAYLSAGKIFSLY